MSKTANKTPVTVKVENKGSGDHRKESGGGRNDRNEKSHSNSHSRSESRESSSRNKQSGSHSDHASNSKSVDSEKQSSAEDVDKGDSKNTEEKKFTGRCRLFVGNLTPDVSEDVFRKMFQAYGEVSEVYVNPSRGFGFIRLDYRQNAESAKAALDGLQRRGRVLRVRFATHGAALRVKNLHPFVSNELLEQAFTQFGELERAIVIVDDRGKPTGEGLVEFVRKPGAQQALRRVKEGVFLFGSDPKPIEVEPLEYKDEEDGMPEKIIPKNEQYKKEREQDPHFAPHGSFEYEFGMRWKQLAEMEKKRIENVKREMEEARIKLEDEMQNALYDYQAEKIRQDLLRQQEELRRLEELRNQDRMRRQQDLEMRTMSRRAEEERERQKDERRRQEMMLRQQEMQRRSGGGHMDSGMARNREEMMSLRGEGGVGFQGGPSGMGMRGSQNQGDPQLRGGRGGAPPMQPPPAPPAGMGLDRGQQGMGMERGPQNMGMERAQQGMGGIERSQHNLPMERGPQALATERGQQALAMERGPQALAMEREQQSMAMERGPQALAMERGQQSLAMERGPQALAMERGQQNMAMERGPQALAMERGSQASAMERGQQNMAMERGPQALAMERGQQNMAMERQNLARMQQGGGSQAGQGNFAGQSGIANNSSAGNPSGNGSPSVNSMASLGGQAGPGSQLQQRQSRFEQGPGNQFEQGFGNRGGVGGSVGGPGGNQGGPGGLGGGGMGGPSSQPPSLFQQMQVMARSGAGPDRAMMERRREAQQPRDDMDDIKRMRRF